MQKHVRNVRPLTASSRDLAIRSARAGRARILQGDLPNGFTVCTSCGQRVLEDQIVWVDRSDKQDWVRVCLDCRVATITPPTWPPRVKQTITLKDPAEFYQAVWEAVKPALAPKLGNPSRSKYARQQARKGQCPWRKHAVSPEGVRHIIDMPASPGRPRVSHIKKTFLNRLFGLDVPATNAWARYSLQASLPYLDLPRRNGIKFFRAILCVTQFVALDKTQAVEHVLWLSLRFGLFPPQVLRRFACDVLLACMDITPLPEDTMFRSVIDQMDILAHEQDVRTYPKQVSQFNQYYEIAEPRVSNTQRAIILAIEHLCYGEKMGSSLHALLQALEVFLTITEDKIILPILLGRLRSKLADRALQVLQGPSEFLNNPA